MIKKSMILAVIGISSLFIGACDKDNQWPKPGKDGEQGEAGVDGTNGKDGSIGKSGINGKDGANGKDGTNGTDGAAGINGNDGPAGKDGTNGVDGEAGKDGANGTNGVDGVNGTNGTNGESLTISSITIPVNRNLDWETNNKVTMASSGFIVLPWQFDVTSISGSLSGGGWIDIRVASQVFCYQRQSSTKRFLFIYKKTVGATTGCDSNSNMINGFIDLNVAYNAADVIQVIPREPKLANLVVDFTFNIAE